MALRLRGATSGYIELKAPASAGDNTLTLPTNNGSANQLLKTDGSGNLSWTDDNSGVSLSGSTNNTIATVTGANALQGEANLTFNGTTLGITRGDSATLDAIVITNSDSVNNGFSLGVSSVEDAFLWNGSNTNMTFATNNTERLRLTSTGVLSLNDSTPETWATLQINNHSTHNAAQVLLRGADQAQIILRDDTGGTDQKCTTIRNDQGVLIFGHHNDAFSAFSEKARIDLNGSLRIGNTNQNQYTAADDLVIGSGSGDRGLTIYSGSSDGGVIAFSDGTVDTAYRSGQIVYDHSANSMDFRTNGNYIRLAIKNNGDFGVGITTPTTQSGRVFHLHAGANQQRLHMTNATTGSSATDGFEIIVEEGPDVRIRNFEAGALMFDSGGTNNEAMRITSAGDIGINTTSPSRKFHVNGMARVSGAFEAYPSSTSAVSAGTFYNNSTGASADCRVQIKTYANQGADPYLHFDAGGSNFICGMKYEGTTNNKFLIGAGDSPSSGILGGLYVHGGGNISINSSSNPSRRLAIYDTSQVQIYSYGNCAAHFNQQYQSSTNSGTQYYNVFTRLDGSWDGYIVSSSDGAISLTNGSDYRLKDNVVSMTNGIDIVKKLNPITYKWKASTGRDTSITMQGFLAHEVDEAGVIGAVDGEKDGVWDTAENPAEAAVGDPRYQGLSLERLVPALTAGLKEAIAKIETLETKVAALESA